MKTTVELPDAIYRQAKSPSGDFMRDYRAF
jgi:hypothetical protein